MPYGLLVHRYEWERASEYRNSVRILYLLFSGKGWMFCDMINEESIWGEFRSWQERLNADRCTVHGNSMAVVDYIYVYLLWRGAAKRAWREGFVIQANAVQVVLLGGKPGPMEAPALDCRTTWRLLTIDFLLELGLKCTILNYVLTSFVIVLWEALSWIRFSLRLHFQVCLYVASTVVTLAVERPVNGLMSPALDLVCRVSY